MNWKHKIIALIRLQAGWSNTRVCCLLGIGLTVVVLVGCLPVEVDVSQDGRLLIPRQEGFFILDSASGKVTPAFQPKGGQAVFARFVPASKQIVVVTDAGEGGPSIPGMGGGGEKLMLVNLADGSTKNLLTAQNVTYLTISPDGKFAAYTRLGDNQTDLGENNKETLPELHILDLNTGADRALGDVGGVASMHRWFADSKSLLVFHIEKKMKQNYSGTLCRLDVASGKTEPLAGAIGSNNVVLDVSPDGKMGIFTAIAAGTAGTELKSKEENQQGGSKLFQVSIDKKTVRQALEDITFARFSPDGKRVLLYGQVQNKGGLKTADANFANIQLIANDATMQVGGDPASSANVYPNWVGNDRVSYLAQHAVYGKAGKNLELMVAGIDGKEHRSYQSSIDAEARKGER